MGASLKYYLYVSDAKVDMLFGQLPDKLLRKASVDLSIDIGPLKAAVKVGETPPEDRRFQRLQLVVKALEDSGEPIGGLFDECKWVRATGRFVWRLNGDESRRYPVLMTPWRELEGETGAFFAGSIKHVVGRKWSRDPDTGNDESTSMPTDIEFAHFAKAVSLSIPRYMLARKDDDLVDAAMAGELNVRDLRYVASELIPLEFMAIVYTRWGKAPIGSPLYVALP